MITLKILEAATAQEVFDQGAKHLLTQNQKCETEGICLYRYNGLKCVGGCFIADDEYKPEFEGRSWHSLVSARIAPKTHEDLIRRLQLIHDEEPVVLWSKKLKELAESIGLNYTLT